MNKLLDLSSTLGNNDEIMTRSIESLPQVPTDYSWLPYLDIDGFMEIMGTRYENFGVNNHSLQLLNQTEYQMFIAIIAQRRCSAKQPRGIVELNDKFKDPKLLEIGELLYRQSKAFQDEGESGGISKIRDYNDFSRLVNARLLGINNEYISLQNFKSVVVYVAQC